MKTSILGGYTVVLTDHSRAVLPELAAEDQLVGFWRFLARDDIFSVSYEQFAVGLDEKFGQSLWSEFPDIANKGERR